MTTTEAERVAFNQLLRRLVCHATWAVLAAGRDDEEEWQLEGQRRQDCMEEIEAYHQQALLTERRRGLEAQVMDVTQWANATFGAATWSRQLQRAKEELEEVEQCLDDRADDDFSKLAEEVADVIICLFRILGDTGHPDMIARKMDVNKARQWNVGPDGCAYHVKAQATPKEDKP